jgi:hypothetical protein
MYVSINKKPIRLQKCYGVLLGFASEVLQDVAFKCLHTDGSRAARELRLRGPAQQYTALLC